jgi:outer membrane protein OmpA-like peptidoglycan-associated protein
MASPSLTSGWSSPRAAYRAREDGSLKWWIAFAFVLSILFHALLYLSFDELSLALRMPARLPPAKPATAERLKIDPRLLQEQKVLQNLPDQIAPAGRDQDLKAFQAELDAFDKAQAVPENQEMDLTPKAREITHFMRGDPGSGQGALKQDMAALLAPKPVAAAAPQLAEAMAQVRSQALAKPTSPNQLLLDAAALPTPQAAAIDLDLAGEAGKAETSAANAQVKGFSNLDQLLGGGGTLGASTAPILMPTDLLFAYGSDELAENARLSLMKLGFLIQKNPQSLFIIEGHTDSFGNEEYNDKLSRRRAQAVVDWLVRSLRLDTARIRAVGMGKRHPLVSTEGTQEEQGLNRRVEIKVRPLKKS